MRVDPRKACGNERERLMWALLHDLIAHPLMALTGFSAVSLRFHDWTSRYAWPRDGRRPSTPINIIHPRFGVLAVRVTESGFWEISHGVIAHRLVVKARDLTDAIEQAEEWFDSVVELIPHSDIGEKR